MRQKADDKIAENMFTESYRHSEFLYSRNGQCKIVDLAFYEKQYVEKYLLIDLLEIDSKKKDWMTILRSIVITDIVILVSRKLLHV